jgi:hypothetical protein
MDSVSLGKRTSGKRRKVKDDTKTGVLTVSREHMADTYLLAMRGPAYRRHDSYVGFRTELENRAGDGKGKGKVEAPRGRKYRSAGQGRTAS